MTSSGDEGEELISQPQHIGGTHRTHKNIKPAHNVIYEFSYKDLLYFTGILWIAVIILYIIRYKSIRRKRSSDILKQAGVRREQV